MLNPAVVVSLCLTAGSVGRPVDRGEATVDAINFGLTSLPRECRLDSHFGEMYLEVAVVCDSGTSVPVRGLRNLAGLVTIDNEAKALEFVRLFSAGRRWMLTGVAEYAEVRAGPKAEPDSFVVAERVFSRCCTPPAVRRVDGPGGETAFEVKRTVVDRAYGVYLLAEVVSRNGTWRVVDRRKTRVRGRDLGLWVIHDH
jgi:hypothetical protein